MDLPGFRWRRVSEVRRLGRWLIPSLRNTSLIFLGDRQLGLQLRDPPPSSGELELLLSGFAELLAAVDAVLLEPVIDRHLRDPERDR